ncbi:hypothetical protein [Novosphingobium sp. AAP1]|uniref:hypothetical protein n=1 Tax=Novosphingobium sp. AAP1 TaxID=1523413 RepID=UPI000AB3C90B|nr:hypothetical protein [Novosphingobium sp. AAP1]
MTRFHALLAGSALAALLASTGLHAEDAEAPRTIAPGEIVVTGEKAARTLQHTPTSIAVTSPEKITRETLLSIQDVYALTDVPDYYDNRTSTADQPNRGWVASDIALFRLSVPLADGLKLSSATSWNRSRVQSVADSDNTAANLSTINNLYRFKTLTQELRVNYEGDRLSALLGA